MNTLDNYNLDLLKRDPSFTIIETDNYRTINEYLDEALRSKKAIAFISQPGYGAYTAIKQFKKATAGSIYILRPHPGEGIKTLLSIFLTEQLPPIINFANGKFENLLSAAKYFLENNKSGRRYMFIIYNIDFLPETHFYRFSRIIKELEGIASFAFTVTKAQLDRLKTKANTKNKIEEFLNARIQYINIPPVTPEELKLICFKRGILKESQQLSLINNVEDHNALIANIEILKKNLRENYNAKV